MRAANQRYLSGGLAAVYPETYGRGGLLERMAGYEFPEDRFAPSKKTLRAQLANGVIDQADFDRAMKRAV